MIQLTEDAPVESLSTGDEYVDNGLARLRRRIEKNEKGVCENFGKKDIAFVRFLLWKKCNCSLCLSVLLDLYAALKERAFNRSLYMNHSRPEITIGLARSPEATILMDIQDHEEALGIKNENAFSKFLFEHTLEDYDQEGGTVNAQSI
jgi:hypothetical protein